MKGYLPVILIVCAYLGLFFSLIQRLA